MDYQFDVYDTWCETALPRGRNLWGAFRGSTPYLASWGVTQWQGALEGLLDRYDPTLRSAAKPSDQQVRHELDVLEERGLLTAMHWLLLGLDHTFGYVAQVLEIKTALRAFRLRECSDLTRDEKAQLERIEPRIPWEKI